MFFRLIHVASGQFRQLRQRANAPARAGGLPDALAPTGHHDSRQERDEQ
jgi:hypothetical protein